MSVDVGYLVWNAPTLYVGYAQGNKQATGTVHVGFIQTAKPSGTVHVGSARSISMPRGVFVGHVKTNVAPPAVGTVHVGHVNAFEARGVETIHVGYLNAYNAPTLDPGPPVFSEAFMTVELDASQSAPGFVVTWELESTTGPTPTVHGTGYRQWYYAPAVMDAPAILVWRMTLTHGGLSASTTRTDTIYQYAHWHLQDGVLTPSKLYDLFEDATARAVRYPSEDLYPSVNLYPS